MAVRIHGINSVGQIQNAVVENLAADPVPVLPGRCWYNTTEKALKFSSLDAGGGVVVKTIQSKAEVDSLTSLVNTINADSTTEGSFRKAIADVVNAAPEALDTLQEIAAAMNNDPNLHDTLVNLVNTSISNLNEQILGTATTAMDTLGEVESRVVTLESAVSSATGDVSNLTTDDKSNLVAAINEVDAHSDTNAANLATEVARAQAAEALIRSDLNARVFTMTSASASLTHSVAHNLNAEYADITVYVQRADGLYYRDIPEVKLVDSNTMQVALIESANIKVVVRAYNAL
jgi:hypothetical protein